MKNRTNSGSSSNNNNTTTNTGISSSFGSMNEADDNNYYRYNSTTSNSSSSNDGERQGLISYDAGDNHVDNGDVVVTSSSSTNDTVATQAKSYIRPLLVMFVVSAIVFYIGWYVPRTWMNRDIDWIIARNTPPYQIITTTTTTTIEKSGQPQPSHQLQRFVVLDPTYNHPVIDPPQISSSFLIFTSVTLPLMVMCLFPFLSLILATTTTTTSTNDVPLSMVPLKSLQRWCCRMTMLTTTTIYSKQQQYQQRGCLYAFYICIISISGLLCSIGICEGITQCIKMYIGRLRPNMYQLCQFDSETLEYSTTVAKERIREGHLSFPSGHSSLASVTMMYCTWYFLFYFDYYSSTLTRTTTTTSLNASNNGLWMQLLSSLRTLTIVLVLPGWAVFVGMTRIVDHWHHVSDVIAGLLLGGTIGSIGFRGIAQPILGYIMVYGGGGSGGGNNELTSQLNRSYSYEQQKYTSSSAQMSILPTQNHINNVDV